MPLLARCLVLLLELLLLFGLARGVEALLGRGLQRRSVYYLLVAPGCVLHELGHLVACWLVGARPERVQLFWPDAEQGTLGQVEYRLARDAHLRRMTIALAPLVVGTAALAAVLAWLLPPLVASSAPQVTAAAPAGLFDLVVAGLRSALQPLETAALSLREASASRSGWQLVLGGYLLVTITASLSPSGQDLRLASGGLWRLALFGTVAVLALAWMVEVAPWGGRLTPWLLGPADRLGGLWAVAIGGAAAGLALLAGLALVGALLRGVLRSARPRAAAVPSAWLLLALLAAGLSACGSGPPVLPHCETDADCPDGLSCRAESAVCVGFTTPIVPASDGGDGGLDGGDGAGAGR